MPEPMVPSCNCTCQIAGAHDPDCAVMGGQQEPAGLPQAAVDAAREAITRSLAEDYPETWMESDDLLARKALAAAAPHLAATEREHIAQAAEIQALAHLAEGSRIAADALKRFAEVIRNPEGT